MLQNINISSQYTMSTSKHLRILGNCDIFCYVSFHGCIGSLPYLALDVQAFSWAIESMITETI